MILSKPQFPHLQNGDNSTYLLGAQKPFVDKSMKAHNAELGWGGQGDRMSMPPTPCALEAHHVGRGSLSTKCLLCSPVPRRGDTWSKGAEKDFHPLEWGCQGHFLLPGPAAIVRSTQVIRQDPGGQPCCLAPLCPHAQHLVGSQQRLAK